MHWFETSIHDTAQLQYVDTAERKWIDSLTNPFESVHVTTGGHFEVFVLDKNHHDEKFNPFCSMIFYMQKSHIQKKETFYNTRNGKTYYINQPMYKPTGVVKMDGGSIIITCRDGYLHNASGEPAMVTGLFGPAYYLHGQNYEPIEYFRMLEDQRKHRAEWFYYHYPEYNPGKYTEFMANVLGGKK